MKQYTLISLVVLLISGCENSDQEASKSEQVIFPEISEENCRKENVAKLPKQYVAEFSSMCLRQGNATPSEHKEW